MLFIKLKAEISTFSPFHSASGKETLLSDYDFLRQGNQILVLNIDKMLELIDERKLKEQLEPKITNLITPSQYSRCLAYILHIEEPKTPYRIVAQQKDTLFHPYIAGSSVKGALRTALLWHHLQGLPNLNMLDPKPKCAFSSFERKIFGPDPYHDLLRALRISDFLPLASVTMQAMEIRTYTLLGQPPRLKPHPNPRLTNWVEVIPENTKFSGEIWLDDYLIKAPKLNFDKKREWLEKLQLSCQKFAQAIIEREKQFYEKYGMPEIADFYKGLHNYMQTLSSNQFLIQLGWGTGWQTKTIGTKLSPEQIRQIVRRYRLDRGRNYPVFPKTRRLVQKKDKPFKPLGWVTVTLDP